MTLLAALVAVVVALLLIDLRFFARGRETSWFVLGIAVALPLWAIDGGDGAVNYLTVYLIERTLSLDNLFVFLLIFGAFAVPQQERGKLLFWGIVLALGMRGVAIVVLKPTPNARRIATRPWSIDVAASAGKPMTSPAA